MSTRHTLVLKALSTVVVAGALAVAGGTAAQAAPFVFCSTAKAGKTGMASCAANGTAYTFQAKVVCQSIDDPSATRQLLGAVTNPGGSSSATCATTETIASVSSVVL